MNDELFKAILSLDSYNRGYDAGIDLIGIYIGNAQLIDESVSLDTQTETARDQAIGFFAQAYAIDLGGGNTEISISFRGTNTWIEPMTGYTLPSLLDMWHGWRLGNEPANPNSFIEFYGESLAAFLASDTDAEQGMMAVEFYKYIVDTYTPTELYIDNSSISLTGHSLGGGLAAFISSVYRLYDTKVYDTMTYDQAAELTSSYIVTWRTSSNTYESLLTPDELATFEQIYEIEILDVQPYDDDLHTLVYGSPNIGWQNDASGVEGYILEGEVLDNPLIGRTGDDEKYKYDLGFVEENFGLTSTQLHSMTTLAIRMFAEEAEVSTDDWKDAAQYFWPLMYDQGFAQSIGMDHSSLMGKNQADGDYASILRAITAYSAIDEGTRVFGDTGIRALYDDANNLGLAISTIANTASYVTYYATDISKVFVQYAGLLAASKILESSNAAVVSGVLDYIGSSNPDILTVNFKAADWLPMHIDFRQTMAVTRDGLVEHIFADFKLDNDIDLDAFIKDNGWFTNTFLEGESSGEVFNRVIFAATDAGSEELDLEEVGEYFKGTLYVGSAGNDTVTLEVDSNDRTVFIGNGGTDSFIGGDNTDIAIGGSGEDVLDGGGAADFLYGAGGYDLLVGGTGTDLVIGGTGNDVFIADADGDDIYHGGYTAAELAPFWNTDPFDMDDLTRQNDGLDKVDYTHMTGVVFDVTVLDETLGNYWVDKYYNGTYFYGPWDRDVLFSIEDLQIDAYARRDVGGAIAAGNESNNSLHYSNFGGYNVARSYYGYGGNDTITGGLKNDFLSGGTGDDTLSGGAGDDNYYYNLGDGDDYINDAGAGSIDVLIFGDGILSSQVTLARYSGFNMIVTFNDSAEITIFAQTYSTGNAIDYFKFYDGTIWDMQATIVPVYGTSGNDTNLQGAGSSTTQREGAHINDIMYGYGGNDLIRSYDGDDILYGGDGNDDLRGDVGNDILYGENGNDVMTGGGDNDTLYGGAGLDTMTGGLGADTFVFESASAFSNIDTITDFKQSDNDKLDISDILEGYYNYGVDVITDFVQITQSGTTAYLSINQSGSGGGSYTQIATLTGLGTQNLTDEAALEASGRLITHVV